LGPQDWIKILDRVRSFAVDGWRFRNGNGYSLVWLAEEKGRTRTVNDLVTEEEGAG
jgi:hypothetical protein